MYNCIMQLNLYIVTYDIKMSVGDHVYFLGDCGSSCFSFSRFINMSPAELHAVMLVGLYARLVPCCSV